MAKTYDDHELATDIAAGKLTSDELGAKYGLCPGYVKQIMCGVRRPEILALVDQIAKAMLAATLRKAAAGAGEILSELHRQATKSGKVGDRRKAAELVLKHVAGDPSRPQVQVTQAQGVAVSLDGLSDETKATVLKELNGPCLTPEQPDEPPDGPSDASPCETGESA